MQKLLFLILSISIVTISIGQSASELNNKATLLLSKKHNKKAIILLKKAAELGDAEAQHNLCRYYYGFYNNNTNNYESTYYQTDSLANSWLIKSAMQGWRSAQIELADRYSRRSGGYSKKDEEQAVYWYSKLAEQGDTNYIFLVATFYLYSINKNSDSLILWAKKVAALETVECTQLNSKMNWLKLKIAMMFQNGDEPLSKNYFSSYVWFLIYNEIKNSFTTIEQERHFNPILEIQSSLTEDEKLQAIVEAEKILKQKLKKHNLINKYDNNYPCILK